MVTEISNAPLPDSDVPSWAQSWDAGEMQTYLEKGICKQVETIERIGIQPFWIKNIEVGAMEELRYELGKWSEIHEGYLLGFKRPIQLPAFGIPGRHPRPFLYYKFKVARYLYTPTEGQQLKAIITGFGQKVAICVVFDKFVATVHPRNEKEFTSWNIGDEFEFVVESFEKHRARGVTIKGRSVGGKVKKTKRVLKPTLTEEVEAEIVESSEIVEPSDEPQPEPRKKSKRKSKTVVKEEGVSNEPAEVIHSPEDSEPPKKKRKKSKPTDL
jgi:hypothetical protein